MLKREENDPFSIAINIFDLAMLARYLDKPYYFIHYVQNRIKFYDKTRSDVESNFLSAYIDMRLYMWGDDYNYVVFDNSWAKSVDSELLPQYERQQEIKVDNNKWRDSTFDEMLAELDETADVRVSVFILSMLNFSKKNVMEIGSTITRMLNETRNGYVKSCSIAGHDFGFTFIILPMKGKDEVYENLKSMTINEMKSRGMNSWLTVAHFHGSDKLVGTMIMLNKPC